jgi:hypothetical protein
MIVILNTQFNSMTTKVLTFKFNPQMQHSNGMDKQKAHFNKAFSQNTLYRRDQQDDNTTFPKTPNHLT